MGEANAVAVDLDDVELLGALERGRCGRVYAPEGLDGWDGEGGGSQEHVARLRVDLLETRPLELRHSSWESGARCHQGPFAEDPCELKGEEWIPSGDLENPSQGGTRVGPSRSLLEEVMEGGQAQGADFESADSVRVRQAQLGPVPGTSGG